MTIEQRLKDPKDELCQTVAEMLGQKKPYNHIEDCMGPCIKCGRSLTYSNVDGVEVPSGIGPCKYPDPPEGSIADIAFACIQKVGWSKVFPILILQCIGKDANKKITEPKNWVTAAVETFKEMKK